MASIPLTAEAVEMLVTAHLSETPGVLPDSDAERLQDARKRHLRWRALCFGVVAAVLVAIWGLTGPELPWIVWPLLGIGFVAALDAWRVLGLPPLRESDLHETLNQANPDRAAAIDAARRRRHFRHRAGGLGILNLFLIGIWIAGGADYFWPAWVILGSLVALAIAALPRAGRAHDLLGDHA